VTEYKNKNRVGTYEENGVPYNGCRSMDDSSPHKLKILENYGCFNNSVDATQKDPLCNLGVCTTKGICFKSKILHRFNTTANVGDPVDKEGHIRTAYRSGWIT